MVSTLSRNWWAVALRGVIAIVFGIGALARPGVTLEALVLVFGFYAIVDGAFSLIGGVGMIGSGEAWGGPVASGLVGIAVGVVTFFWPGLTALALLYLIAFRAIFTGLMELTAAVQWRKVLPHPAVPGSTGVLSVLFGVLLVAFPGAGALSLVWLIGVYAIVFGIAFVALGFWLRGASREGAALRHAIQGA